MYFKRLDRGFFSLGVLLISLAGLFQMFPSGPRLRIAETDLDVGEVPARTEAASVLAVNNDGGTVRVLGLDSC